MQSGQLRDETVLVSGLIEPYDQSDGFLYGVECDDLSLSQDQSPDYGCLLGQLDGVEPRVYVNAGYIADTANEGTTSAALTYRWISPVAPVEGVLALHVDAEGKVEFLGRVAAGSEPMTWSASDVKDKLDVMARDLDEVILVDAWLTGYEVLASCATGPTVIDGLPGRESCGTASWLTDAPVQIDPRAIVIPQPAVQVQPDAYQTYAPNASAPFSTPLQPQRAVYAIARRLYGGPCIDPSAPCWDWSVIGRLSHPSSDASPSVRPAPTPQLEPEHSVSPSSATVECAAEPNQMGGGGTSPWHVSLHDETGLVESCAGIVGGGEAAPLVSNPAGDLRTIQLEWSGRPCDAEADVTFSADPGGYTVHGILYNTVCRSSLVFHALLLHLRSDVNADDVISLFDRHTPPAPTPSPSQPGTSVLGCQVQGVDVPVSMTIADHSDAVTGCTATVDKSRSITAASAAIDGGDLVVEWPADVSSCVGSRFELELWPPGPALPHWRSLQIARIGDPQQEVVAPCGTPYTWTARLSLSESDQSRPGPSVHGRYCRSQRADLCDFVDCQRRRLCAQLVGAHPGLRRQ